MPSPLGRNEFSEIAQRFSLSRAAGAGFIRPRSFLNEPSPRKCFVFNALQEDGLTGLRVSMDPRWTADCTLFDMQVEVPAAE
ncbi:MAG: hypothetical protein ACREBQ_05190 [Nitrososphaerales archaeon]